MLKSSANLGRGGVCCTPTGSRGRLSSRSCGEGDREIAGSSGREGEASKSALRCPNLTRAFLEGPFSQGKVKF